MPETVLPLRESVSLSTHDSSAPSPRIWPVRRLAGAVSSTFRRQSPFDALLCAGWPILLLLVIQWSFSVISGAAAGVDRYDGELSSTKFNDYPLAQLIGRAGSLLCFAYSLAVVGCGLLFNRQRVSMPGDARWLWCSFLAYWGIQSLRIIINGPGSEWILRCAIPIAVIFALYQGRDTPYIQIYRFLRAFVWTMSLVTVGLLVVAPSYVAPAYQGVLPLFPRRLHGIFCHANNLAYLVTIFWLLPVPPSLSAGPRWLRPLVAMATAAVLVLAQSKTMYLLAILGLALKTLLPLLFKIDAKMRAIIVIGLGAFLITGGLFSDQLLELVFGQTQVSSNDITTLTGRKLIWEQMLGDWRQNMWFGFGYDQWLEAIYRVDKWITPNAHNQWVQTLWETGIVGAIALALHYAAMVYYACRLPVHYRSGMLAILTIMLIRSYSEAQIGIFVILEIQLAIHLVVFASICSLTHEMATRREASARLRWRAVQKKVSEIGRQRSREVCRLPQLLLGD